MMRCFGLSGSVLDSVLGPQGLSPAKLGSAPLSLSHPPVRFSVMTILEVLEPGTTDVTTPDSESVAGLMAPVVDRLSELSFRDAVIGLGVCRSMLAAVEANHVSARSDSGHDAKSTRRTMQTFGDMSTAEAAKATRRGQAAAINPKLAADMASGDLSIDHANVIADAASKTDGAAASDSRFLDRVMAANPDQAAKIAAGYVEDHREETAAAAADSEYDRQYRLRSARVFQTRAGTKMLQLEGPGSTIDQLWAQLRQTADHMYRADGGRTVPGNKHSRSREQRLFDAAINQLTNLGDAGGGKNGDSQSSSGTSCGSQATGRGRPAIVATIDLNKLLHGEVGGSRDVGGARHIDYEQLATELIGSGPIPTVVTEYLACNSDWVGVIFGQNGEVLWQGRKVRYPTKAQILALTVRDQGCVLCGANPDVCEAHHLIPWNAPSKGRTDIDGLALLCVDCHHRIHDTKQTLHHNPATQTWQLRAATISELPRHAPRTPDTPKETKSSPGRAGIADPRNRVPKPKTRRGNPHTHQTPDADPDL